MASNVTASANYPGDYKPQITAEDVKSRDHDRYLDFLFNLVNRKMLSRVDCSDRDNGVVCEYTKIFQGSNPSLIPNTFYGIAIFVYRGEKSFLSVVRQYPGKENYDLIAYKPIDGIFYDGTLPFFVGLGLNQENLRSLKNDLEKYVDSSKKLPEDKIIFMHRELVGQVRLLVPILINQGIDESIEDSVDKK